MKVLMGIGLYGMMAGLGSVFFSYVAERDIVGNMGSGDEAMMHTISAVFWPFFIPMWAVLIAADIVKKKLVNG